MNKELIDEKPKTATAINADRWDEQRATWVMQRRMEDFYERYMPEDRQLASQFASDLHMLVRSIYAEASEPANKQLTALLNRLPFTLPSQMKP